MKLKLPSGFNAGNTKRLSPVAYMFMSLRKMAKLTQFEVSELLGIGRTSVTNIERGKQAVTIEQLDKLAKGSGYQVCIEIKPLSALIPDTQSAPIESERE
jgi:transcriptional regulator with XRE-family HTH domain